MPCVSFLYPIAPVLQHKARQFMYSRQLLECRFIGGLVGLGSTAPTPCTAHTA